MSIFDVGVDHGVHYVVFELLEGDTLRARLAAGALAPRVACDLAVQMARGMAAAHQKGIVHRDLKPENLFITADGLLKILDFGLAKLMEPAATPDGATQAPATGLTMPGMVLGTAGYMAPEQVRGEPSDHRSDIFAFGAVVYEMLTGARVFVGDTGVEVMTAILRYDPPELAAPAVPRPLDRIVRRCLEKVPTRRFQSASDIAFALEALAAPTAETSALALAPTADARPPWRLAWLAAAAAIGLLVGGALTWLTRAPAQPSSTQTFEAKTFDRRPITNARFMPDGQTIVYSTTSAGNSAELFVINPSAEAPQALGVVEAHLLAVSARGELALIVNARLIDQRLYGGTLARMTVGSSPRAVTDNVREADWSPDGSQLAVVHDLGNGRDRLEYPAGTALHEASGYLSDPRVSPDGERVAFFEHQWRWDDRGMVKVVDRAGTVTALAGEFFGLQGLSWTPDGTALVFSGNSAGGSVLQPMTVPATGGGAATPLAGVPGRFIVHDVARDGRWLAVREDLSLGVRVQVPGADGERDLSWLGSTGARDLSADHQWLLMVDVGARAGPNYGVVLRKTDGSQAIRLGEGSAQRLSPDGRWAAAIIATPPQVVLYPTGPGETVRLANVGFDGFASVEWFPDGRHLLMCGSRDGRAPRCYQQDLAGSSPVTLTDEGVLARLAPDGRTLLLTLPDGTFQLTTMDGGAARAVPGLTAGDRQIGWSADSRAIFVQRSLAAPARIERLDLATGERTVARQLVNEGTETVSAVAVVAWLDEGRAYACNVTSVPSTMFVVRAAID
jgi:eukaryotic-like serine/threonine-protein kinase